jgi:hypothetical protein
VGLITRKRILQWWNGSVIPRVPERVWLWLYLTSLIFSDSYPSAQYAVRKAATDPSLAGVKYGDAWQRVLNRANLYPQLGENLLRNAEAVEWVGHHLETLQRREPLWRRHLLCELAYLALKERGR